MKCPVCSGDMWDANNSKYPKKEGAPDYRCKDKECKWKKDPETGEWIESDYVTGVWLPKPKKAAPRPSPAAARPTGAAPIQEHAKKEMLISYAKDIVCAEIAKGVEVKEPFKRVADGFKVLMMAYAHPFGKPPAPKPAPEPEPVPDVDLNEEDPQAGEEGGEEVPF